MGSVYGNEGFYYGESSSLNPNPYNSIGGFEPKKESQRRLGFPGSVNTANQLGEAVNAIKQGITAFEVEMLNADQGETIPKEHFKEMRQLMKISGVSASMHAPIIDPAGFNEKEGWSPENMQDNERRMYDNIKKAYELNPKGNTPIVFHSSGGVPGGEWRRDENGEIKKNTAMMINQETGQIVPIKLKKMFTPTNPEELNIKNPQKGGHLWELDSQINSANATDWDKRIIELQTFNKHASEIISDNVLPLANYSDKKIIIDEEGIKAYNPKTKQLQNALINDEEIIAYNKIQQADTFISNIETSFNTAFEKAFEYGTEEQRVNLKELAKEHSKKINKLNNEFTEKINGRDKQVIDLYAPIKKQLVLDESIKRLDAITKTERPKIYTDVEEFAKNKAAETFANLAEKSYKEFKDNAPILAIENMPQGMAFTRAQDLKEIVEKAKNLFVERMTKSKTLSKNKAEEIATKQIGVTWDVGHINMLKKSGLTDEDIKKETKTIAPYVKHLHLTDNFGYADTHLAPGMGNVPFKQILEELEKAGKLQEINKIIEAGAFVQHFKKSPFPLTLSAMGSSIYGAKLQDYWSNVQNTYGGYFGGYGTINPSTHHSIYGSGFTTLPMELGGNIPSGNSRFSGDKI